MITKRVFLLRAALMAASAVSLKAQDDSYSFVRFTNESHGSLKLKLWNPRVARSSFAGSVAPGQSIDITGADGKPARLGMGSSQIQVNGQPARSLITVAPREGERHVVTWTDHGFKTAESPLPPPTPPDAHGFTELFNGRDFTGWRFNDALASVWSVNDWRLHAKGSVKGGGFDLWSEKSYRDLALYVDWRLPAPAKAKALPTFTPDGLYVRDAQGQIVRKEIPDAGDSGVYLRGEAKYQVNLWSQPMGSGDINELHKDASLPSALRRRMIPKVRADAPFGQWNRFFITLKGDHVTVVLNEQTIIDDVPLPGMAPEGPIALQYHGDEIEFANIYLREL